MVERFVVYMMFFVASIHPSSYFFERSHTFLPPHNLFGDFTVLQLITYFQMHLNGMPFMHTKTPWNACIRGSKDSKPKLSRGAMYCGLKDYVSYGSLKLMRLVNSS